VMFKNLRDEFREDEERKFGGREGRLAVIWIIWLYVAFLWFVYPVGS